MGGAIVFDGILRILAVIVAINKKLPAAILIRAGMSVMFWLAYLKDNRGLQHGRMDNYHKSGGAGQVSS
jgi:hypothetical protein